MAATHFVLFGGAGFIGQHLAKHLRDQGFDVTVVCHGDTVVQAPANSHFVHLACPRNNRAQWDWHRAEVALDEGLVLATRYTGTKLLISSMSVYDHPDNEYARFKRMAERAVLPLGWRVIRLPTVLGAAPGLAYRADLGLHQIANALARSHAARWVSRTVYRHVASVEWVVARIVSRLVNPGPPVDEASFGWVRYADLVPHDVSLQDGSSPEYVAGSGVHMDKGDVVGLRRRFAQLVDDIAERRVHAC